MHHRLVSSTFFSLNVFKLKPDVVKDAGNGPEFPLAVAARVADMDIVGHACCSKPLYKFGVGRLLTKGSCMEVWCQYTECMHESMQCN